MSIFDCTDDPLSSKQPKKWLVCKKCGDEYETDKQKSAWCEQCINEAEPIVSADYQ